MTTNTFEEPRSKMRALRNEFNNEVAAIRSDGGFNDQGRKVQLAAALLKYRGRAQALRETYDISTGDTREKLTAKLFGIPTGVEPATVLVYRDAADRAEKLTRAEDAMTALGRALLHRDTVLARAVASYANDRRWYTVVDHYAAETGQDADWETLRSLPTEGAAKTGITALYAVPPPAELRGLTDRDLAALVRA